jgi:hypothetical protein
VVLDDGEISCNYLIIASGATHHGRYRAPARTRRVRARQAPDDLVLKDAIGAAANSIAEIRTCYLEPVTGFAPTRAAVAERNRATTGHVESQSSGNKVWLMSPHFVAPRYPPSTSFVPLPRWTWAGPEECECCGAYIPKLQRCGQCGSTSTPRTIFPPHLCAHGRPCASRVLSAELKGGATARLPVP